MMRPRSPPATAAATQVRHPAHAAETITRPRRLGQRETPAQGGPESSVALDVVGEGARASATSDAARARGRAALLRPSARRLLRGASPTAIRSEPSAPRRGGTVGVRDRGGPITPAPRRGEHLQVGSLRTRRPSAHERRRAEQRADQRAVGARAERGVQVHTCNIAPAPRTSGQDRGVAHTRSPDRLALLKPHAAPRRVDAGYREKGLSARRRVTRSAPGARTLRTGTARPQGGTPTPPPGEPIGGPTAPLEEGWRRGGRDAVSGTRRQCGPVRAPSSTYRSHPLRTAPRADALGEGAQWP